MKLKTLLFGFTLSLFSITTMAGSDHGHSHSPVNQETAKTRARKIVISFVEKGKLDQSWKYVKANSVDKKVFKGKPEWVAVFVNKKVTDTDKQKLYVFLTLGGEYIAANYTGN